MTKVSVFSNGHSDTYKGQRDVKAGWMITGPNGDFRTGHSIDRATAQRTAEGYAPYLAGAPMHVTKPGGRTHPAREAYLLKEARAAGFKSNRAHYADYQAKIAAFRAACKIEVVDL